MRAARVEGGRPAASRLEAEIAREAAHLVHRLLGCRGVRVRQRRRGRRKRTVSCFF